MQEALLKELRKISEEEKRILEGDDRLQRELYTTREHEVYEAAKLLASGKLISVRPHTRFLHFPPHSHDYIEVIYMCEGSTTHIVNGQTVVLEKGELLFLNQNAVHEIYPAKETDLAVNFIILPEFFDMTLKAMQNEENQLRNFLVDCLKGDSTGASYLHFHVAEVPPVQNLVENLIYSNFYPEINRRSISQTTMSLLFLYLTNHTDKVDTDESDGKNALLIYVLSYIEENYRKAELSELADELHYDVYFLSKEIKKITGRNYTDLLQDKRLSQAAYLLENTDISVLDICHAVGYDNASYFHRIFQNRYGMTPRKFRLNAKAK